MTDIIPHDPASFGAYAPTGQLASLLALTRRCGATWLGRRQAYFLRAIAVWAMRGKPLDVESLGANMRLYPFNNICEKRILFTPQYFDESERVFLKSKLTPGFVFIDIGANIGGYSLYMGANAGPQARILAIEPQPEIFERLVYNIRQNPFATIKALNCAVADKDGEISLFVDSHNQGETSMRMVNSFNAGQVLRVPAVALAGLLAHEGIERVDAIKLDVEGAEDLILEAFVRAAPEKLWPRVILLENSPTRWTMDLHGLIAGLGYGVALRTRNNIAYERA